MPAITLGSLLAEDEIVDLVDADIQGSEADVFESTGERLNEVVRRVHIGTHSDDNEEETASALRRPRLGVPLRLLERARERHALRAHVVRGRRADLDQPPSLTRDGGQQARGSYASRTADSAPTKSAIAPAARRPACPSHKGIGPRLGESSSSWGISAIRSGCDAEHGVRAELDGDRSLRRVAEREAAHAERGRLLLDTAGVGDDEPRARLRGRGSRGSRAAGRPARRRRRGAARARAPRVAPRAWVHREDDRQLPQARRARRPSQRAARGRRRAPAGGA